MHTCIHIHIYLYASLMTGCSLCAENLLKFSVFTFYFSYLVMPVITFSPGNLHVWRFGNGNKEDLMWIIK